MRLPHAALLGALLPAAAVGSGTLAGKMAMYGSLLGAKWTCSAEAADRKSVV